MILKVPSGSIETSILASPVLELLKGLPCKRLFSITGDSHSGLPEGPFFMRNSQIYQQWKLYDDVYDAFHLPTIQQRHDDQM